MDALGGDHPPEEIVAGAVAAATDGVEPVVYGPADLDTHGLEHVVTSEMVEMDDKPAEAVRGKPDSSLVRAVRAVGDGDADAVVSAGNTGAVLAASLLHVRRLPVVYRPGIAIVIPTEHGPSVLIDAGANAEARPEHLLQFGHMGSIFAEEVLGIERPRVRLLSIGEEPEKGNQLTLDAHALLEASSLSFEGNVEGPRAARGRGRRDRLRRLHRQRRAEDPRGHDPEPARRAPLGARVDDARQARRPADPARRRGACGRGSTPRRRAAATSSACAESSSSRTARALGSRSRTRSRLAGRGIEHDIVGRLQQTLPERVVESSRSTNPSGTTRG